MPEAPASPARPAAQGLDHLVRELNVDAATREEAQSILGVIRDGNYAAHVPEGRTEAMWAACAVFIAAHREHLELPRPLGAKGGAAKAASGDKAVRLARGNGIQLMALLKAAGVSLVDFFEHVKVLSEGGALGSPELVLTMKSLKEQYVITNVLYNKFSSLWTARDALVTEAVTAAAGEGGSAGPQGEAQEDPNLFNFVWLLYVHVRHHDDARLDLLSSYHVLLATLEVILLHSHPDLKSSASTTPNDSLSQEASPQSSKAAAAILFGLNSDPATATDSSLLQSLAKRTGVAQERIREERARVQAAAADLLADKVLMLQGGHMDGAGDAEPPYAHLFHPTIVELNLLNMNTAYGTRCLDIAHLDERYVLNQKLSRLLDTPAKQVTQSVRPAAPQGATRQLFADYNANASWGHAGVMNTPGPAPQSPTRVGTRLDRGLQSPFATPHAAYAGRALGFQTPLRSPSRSSGAEMTPISRSKTYLQWMQGLDAQLSEPGPALKAALESCDQRVREGLATRIDSIFSAFLGSRFAISLTRHTENVRNAMPSSDGAESKAGDGEENEDPRSNGNEVVPSLDLNSNFYVEKKRTSALYYAVLEELVKSETRRLQSSDHSAILLNDRFHRSILACCSEVILKPGSIVAFTYPDLLDYFELTAFDFQKVIESFVRAAPSLPRGLKRHLNDLHELILLQDAWRGESPIFELLDAQRDGGVWPLSKVLERGSRNTPANSPGTAQASLTPQARARQRTLEFFLRRLLAVAARRLDTVTRALQLSHAVVDQIWTLVKHCIFEHHVLVKDRHLDTLMLCSIYAISKISAPGPSAANSQDTVASAPLTFKRIMEAYKSERLFDHWVAVVKNITMSGEGRAKKQGHIIAFYNTIFIRAVRSYVLSFQHMSDQLSAAGRIQSANDAAATAMSLTGSSTRPPMSPNLKRKRRHSIESPGVRNGAAMPPLPETGPAVSSLPHPGINRSSQRVRESNVYVTAPRDLNRSPPLTPRTRALYAFGESPAKDLALINRAVNRRPPPIGDVFDETSSNGDQRKRKRARRVRDRHPEVTKM